MKNIKQILPLQTRYGISDLYNKYAAMLFGYILGIVKDRKLAEQHLVAIFNELPAHLNEINTGTINTWCLLQRLAKQKLSVLPDGKNNGLDINGVDLNIYNARNKFFNLMSEEQKDVFGRVYFHCKTTAQVAIELNKTEDSIRKMLKEIFTIIKKGA